MNCETNILLELYMHIFLGMLKVEILKYSVCRSNMAYQQKVENCIGHLGLSLISIRMSWKGLFREADLVAGGGARPHRLC